MKVLNVINVALMVFLMLAYVTATDLSPVDVVASPSVVAACSMTGQDSLVQQIYSDICTLNTAIDHVVNTSSRSRDGIVTLICAIVLIAIRLFVPTLIDKKEK